MYMLAMMQPNMPPQLNNIPINSISASGWYGFVNSPINVLNEKFKHIAKQALNVANQKSILLSILNYFTNDIYSPSSLFPKPSSSFS